MSETCLLTNAQARQLQRENSQARPHLDILKKIPPNNIQEVDAYGLPKLTDKVPKRSVSLIRWEGIGIIPNERKNI